ncbi:MAG: ABC transporter permease [Pseudobutyrivibrio sp.]|nr:ABC transporter permease [Pseudobutyrivibrio sp.]
MKSKIWISTLREIKETLGRFIAIMAIVALGVGFFSGLKVTDPALHAAMQRYFDDTKFYDFRYVSTLGFEDVDVEKLSTDEYLAAVAGAVYFDIIYESEAGQSHIIRAHSITEGVNELVLVEGHLPENDRECVGDSAWFTPDDIGKKITFSKDNATDNLENFKYREYELTGLVQSPLYIQYERGNTNLGKGVIDAFVFMNLDAFDCDYYMEIYGKLTTNNKIYSTEYNDEIDKLNSYYEDKVKIIADDRYNRIVDEAQSKIDDAQKEVVKGEKELSDAEKEIADGKDKIEDAMAEISDNQKKIDDGKKAIKEARDQLEQSKLMYAGLMDFSQQEEELLRQEKELDKGQKKIDEALTEIEDNKKKISDAELDIAAAKKDIGEAKNKIADGQKDIDDIKKPDIYVLTREANVGYVCFESDSSIVGGIANVFPIFFFLVAAMVCMTTMTRMVEEQRTQIGVLKALGYSSASIMAKYTFYSGTAALLGMGAGFAAGTIVFPQAIWYAYGMMYHTNDVTYYFSPKMLVLSFVVAILCSVGTTALSCRIELMEMAATLMRPKAPKAGKRIFLEYINPLWSRLKFLRKVALRNIFRYKKRLFMMILGISGCTALLVTGFGINDSIANIAESQYTGISLYDIVVSFSEDVSCDEAPVLDKLGYKAKKDYVVFQENAMDFMASGYTKNIYVDVFESGADLRQFMDLHTVEGEAVMLPKAGEVVINARLAEAYNVRIGDEIRLFSEDTGYIDAVVSGINENFIYNYAYMVSDTYIGATGKNPEYKSAYLNIRESDDVHQVSATLMDDEDVTTLTASIDMRDRVANMMKSLNIIIVLVIGCAASLAFIVLYNLTNINITERIREIATIKVLGFYANETASYVFRENILLTIMGAAVGMFLGKALHTFVMGEVVVDMITFDVHISVYSYVYGFLLTLLFTVLVNLFMRRKLNAVSMTESLKSVD